MKLKKTADHNPYERFSDLYHRLAFGETSLWVMHSPELVVRETFPAGTGHYSRLKMMIYR
jgi:hypothetical protein